jgi:hypothetical protein
MWVTEHSVETTATPEAIWRNWSEVDRWPEWNGDIERIDLSPRWSSAPNPCERASQAAGS